MQTHTFLFDWTKNPISFIYKLLEEATTIAEMTHWSSTLTRSWPRWKKCATSSRQVFRLHHGQGNLTVCCACGRPWSSSTRWRCCVDAPEPKMTTTCIGRRHFGTRGSLSASFSSFCLISVSSYATGLTRCCWHTYTPAARLANGSYSPENEVFTFDG